MNGILDNHPAFEALENRLPREVFGQLPSPCYVIEERQLIKNGQVLASVSKNTGCKILLAQKAFSNFDFYPVLAECLAGTEASGLYEARLGAEEMPHKEFAVFFLLYFSFPGSLNGRQYGVPKSLPPQEP